MANFYFTRYKIEKFNEITFTWENLSYHGDQDLIIIAENFDEATDKIKKILKVLVENSDYRAVLTESVEECMGLCGCYGFDDSFSILPVKKGYLW